VKPPAQEVPGLLTRRTGNVKGPGVSPDHNISEAKSDRAFYRRITLKVQVLVTVLPAASVAVIWTLRPPYESCVLL
jgi:hypothetical protein